MEDQEVFKSLFQIGQPISEVAPHIAWWFAEKFAYIYAEAALAVVQRRGPYLHPTLWMTIARQMLSMPDVLDSSVLARWVAVLLRSLRPDGGGELLSSMLSRCRNPEDNNTAFLLFGDLVTPQVKLKPHFSLSPASSQPVQGTDFSLTLRGSFSPLVHAWQTIFLPDLATFAEPLAPVLSSYIQQAYVLMQATRKSNKLWDETSYSRAAIEPHAQGHYRTVAGMELVIDAARDVMGWLAQHRPAMSDALITIWGRLDPPLLRR
jgi:hypothetical protein